MISRRGIIGLLATPLLLPAANAVARETMLMGTVNYRERITLPPKATVVVQLVDISLADAPAQVIAEDRISGATGSPIRYRLRFDITKIEPRRTYALQARISDGDRLMFVNTARHEVFAGGRNNTRIRVQRTDAQQR
jgi:putative lipoprotein